MNNLEVATWILAFSTIGLMLLTGVLCWIGCKTLRSGKEHDKSIQRQIEAQKQMAEGIKGSSEIIVGAIRALEQLAREVGAVPGRLKGFDIDTRPKKETGPFPHSR